MEARAETRDNRETEPALRLEGYAVAPTVAAAYARFSAGVCDLVRDMVEDDEAATRITQAAFIAACQALAVGAEQPALGVPSAPNPTVAAAGACPQLGYADNPGSRYSRPTQLHRCYANGGAGLRLSAHEQNELCLTARFDACPRFNGVASAAVAPAAYGSPHATTVPSAPVRLRQHPSTTPTPDVEPEPTVTRGSPPPRPEPVAGVETEPATSATASDRGPGGPVGESAVRPREETVAAAQAADLRSAAIHRTTRAPAGFAGANLRERPSTSARSLVLLNNGTPVDVLPETATGDGFTWIRARTSEGVEGWIVSTAVGG